MQTTTINRQASIAIIRAMLNRTGGIERMAAYMAAEAVQHNNPAVFSLANDGWGMGGAYKLGFKAYATQSPLWHSLPNAILGNAEMLRVATLAAKTATLDPPSMQRWEALERAMLQLHAFATRGGFAVAPRVRFMPRDMRQRVGR